MSTARMLRSALVVTVALAVLLVAPVAMAASSGATSTATPQIATGPSVTADAGGPLFVQLWPAEENGLTAALVAIEVPESTKLPTVVRLPVVAGTTVQWAGEILGGDPANDPERKYVLRNGVGGTFVEFTLTKSRRAQMDAIGLPLAVKGPTTSLQATWVQTVNSPKTTISVRVPAGAFQVKIKPATVGEPTTNTKGESLYTLNDNAYKIGQKQDISVSYSSQPPTSGGVEMMPLLIGLGSALVVAVIVLFVVISRQQQAVSDRDGDEVDEGETDSGADEPVDEVAEEPGTEDESDEQSDAEDDDTDLSWD